MTISHFATRTKESSMLVERAGDDTEAAITWLEQTLPPTIRRLMGSEDLDMPILQLPVAQLRLAQALYSEEPDIICAGESMGKLSEKLGVKQNALTQAADRLVNHLLAERLTDPDDRRKVKLRLTQEGAELVKQRRMSRAAKLRQVFTALTIDEQHRFLEAVRTLESSVDRLHFR